MKRSTFQFIFILFVLLPFISFSETITFNATDGSGNPSIGTWNQISFWDLNRLPIAGDFIIIPAGFTVEITSTINLIADDCNISTLISISGTLSFPSNGSKLNANCDGGGDCQSNIIVNDGGKIIAPGNDNSNKINLCDVQVYTSKGPDITEPTSLNPSSTLPIELTTFKAFNKASNVELIWSTASESNNDYFSIERSVNGEDFEVIGEVIGAGNSNRTLNYSFTDEDPLKEMAYYRLKQTDFNLDYSYSKLVSVKSEVANKGSFKIYPNPVNKSELINLYFSEDNSDNIEVRVYNAFGKMVFKQTLNNAANTEVSLDFHNSIPQGTYFITFVSNNKVYKKKLIVRD